ncbi:MAG: transketolase C-terminal domain-containing protein [Chloroflexota bacterium]
MSSVLERLNAALTQVMEADDRVYLLGEDILDPYGGAFKVTRGLSTRFPNRVLTTPISEAAIVGVCSGMAMRGLHPVAEIMFGDFVTLIADQLINHAAKFRWMYNEQTRVPIVVRAPMGGRRGYGPTHSQSLEKLFLGIPGLKVLSPNTLQDPAQLLKDAILQDDGPVLFIEHKLLYTCQMLPSGSPELMEFEVSSSSSAAPVSTLRIAGAPKTQVTIAAYGYNFELARAAALKLAYEYEIFAEIVLFSQLSPFDLQPLYKSLERTRRLLTVEEGTHPMGWGAEITSQASQKIPGLVFRRVAALNYPVANSKTLEDEILPSIDSILTAALDILK